MGGTRWAYSISNRAHAKLLDSRLRGFGDCFQLAKCLTLVGRFDEALFECERVIAFDPDQEEAFRLRRVLAERLLEVEK